MKTLFKNIDAVKAKLVRIKNKQIKSDMLKADKYVRESLKYPDSSEYYLKPAMELRANPGRNTIADDYKPRLEIFKLSNGKLTFDPIGGEGRSYGWYSISRLIKGQLVLNVYSYSVTTAKHVGALQGLFICLGLKYVMIEAPNGLQDLERAVSNHISLYATAVVKNNHARIKDKRFVTLRKYQLDLVQKLAGKKVSKGIIANAISKAEESRKQKLEAKRLMPRVIMDATVADKDKPGIHFESDGYISKYTIRRLKEDAMSKGHKKVYVHKPVTLKLVAGN